MPHRPERPEEEMRASRRRLAELVRRHRDAALVEAFAELERLVDEKTESLDHSEELRRTIMESSPDYFMLLDPDGTIRFINRTVPDLSSEEVLGTTIFDYLGERDTEIARDCLARVRSTGQPDRYDVEYRGGDGEVSYFESRVAPVFRDGEVHSLVVSSSDVTDHRRSAEALVASEERHRFLTAHISDAIWTLGLDQRFLYVSPSIERLVGFTAEQFRHQTLEEVLTGESYELAVRTLADELERDGGPGVDPERSRTVDLELVHADGSTVWSESKMSFLRDESGAPCGVLGVTRDISAWREAQEALRRSENRLRQAQRLEAVGQLAGGVAHDFNNLLTVIIGNFDLLVRALHSEDPRRSQLEEIGKAAHRAASLTRQLLAFARRQHLEPKVLSLNDVVTETGRILKRLIPEDVRIVAELDPALGHVEADRGQLEQVLMNLTVNARDAMPRGGELRITTANVDLRRDFEAYDPPVAPGLYVRLTVADEGVGIPRELQAKIFEPFFTTKEIGKGTGMGLATVYGIIKQSRGYIWVESGEGEGTSFEILLPRSAGARVGREEPSPPPAAGGSETVLLVEDDDAVRTLARKILKKAGYRVHEAAGGRSAIEVCAGEGGRIDLIVTDMIMPEMSGDELVRRLKEAFPGLKVLYMSGYGDKVHRRRWQGVEGSFLEKPFTSERLLSKVREVLDG